MKNMRKSIVSILTIALILGSCFMPIKNMENQNTYGAEGKIYRVLELQPDYSVEKPAIYYQSKFANKSDISYDWQSYIRDVKGDDDVRVNVTKKSTSEFNGGDEDLYGNYDLIYIGAKINNKDNDYDSDVYNHMGEEKITHSNIASGARAYLSNYSGCDITKIKRLELENFAKAGGLLLFSGYMFPKDTCNLDNQSNMYQLIKGLGAKYTERAGKENRFGDKSLTYSNVITKKMDESTSTSYVSDLIKNSLKSKDQKCTLNLTEKPVTGDYINPDKDANNRELKYKFTIGDVSGSDASRYTTELYIDLNSDGKYSPAEKASRYMQLVDITGKRVKLNELKKNTQYTLTADLGDYVGIIYWKLRVDKNGTDQGDEVIDYCKVQAKLSVNGAIVSVKKELKVLQITSLENGGYSNLVWLPTKEEGIYLEANYNNATYLKNPAYANYLTEDTQAKNLIDLIVANESMQITNNYFKLYKSNKKIEDNFLEVTIKFWLYTRSLQEFTIKIDRIPGDAFQKEGKYKEIGNYDMLILGFADCYNDIGDVKALQAIESFIQDGRAVLFTHDTTSMVTDNPHIGASRNWGYNINQYFRDILGMDRYGVLGDKIYTSKNVPSDWNKDYTWDSNGNRENAMAFTNGVLRQAGNIIANNVTPVNKGQINTYPYELGDINVATTHGQYYQLNLEAGDIKVWYTLADSNNYYKNRKNVRNDYYIYNRGNITYSGAGHSANLSNDETKLFVNTMVGAYRAANDGITLDIINPDASKDKNGNLYFPVSYAKDKPAMPIGSNLYDKDGKVLTASQLNSGSAPYKRVRFSLIQNSVASIKKIEIAFHVSDGGATKVPITNVFKADGKPVDKTIGLETDVEYYVDIPISYVGKNEKMEAKAVLTLVYSSIGAGGTSTKIIEKKVDFLRRVLFNLN